jgi:hypothetical protein
VAEDNVATGDGLCIDNFEFHCCLHGLSIPGRRAMNIEKVRSMFFSLEAL